MNKKSQQVHYYKYQITQSFNHLPKFITIIMSDTRIWTEYEDLILKKLKEQDKIPKWTAIAQIMTDQYNIKGRNGKQCKDRYMLISDDNQQDQDWDYQQQQKLFHLHSQVGNKWAIIGQQLLNKSDNQVKNHLYSKLRKALRKVNKVIKENFKKQLKEIKPNLICKIIQGAEDKFKNQPLLESDVSEYCTELKMKMLNYSYDDARINPLHDFETNSIHVRNFIEELIDFTKDYKRKPKKVRRASGQNLESLVMENINMLAIPKEDKKIRSNGNSPCHSEVSEEDSEQMAEFNTFSLKIPNELFGIQLVHKSSNCSNKQIKQNIILQQPPDLIMLNQMQEENTESHNIYPNTYTGLSNFSPETKFSTENENPWSMKTSETMWNLSKNDTSCWKGINSGQMIAEVDHVQNQLKKNGLLEYSDDMYNPPFPTNIRKLNVSKKSSFSNFQIQQAQQHMFDEDSSVHPRIRMTGVEGKKMWILDESVERSDKLFKSNEAFGMFESVESKHSDKLFGSIGQE